MSYLKRKLTAGEQLIYTAKLHWIILLRPLMTLVILAMVIGLIEQQRLYLHVPFIMPYKSLIYQIVVGLFVGIPMLKMLMIKWTTNIGVTDQRLLYKHGFLAIEMQGMPLSKIENIDSQQSIMGRVFGYGNITIKGSGSTPIRLRVIARPMQLREALATLLK